VRPLEQGLNDLGAFGSHQALDLGNQAALRGPGAKCGTGDSEENHQSGGERQCDVVGQRRS